MIEEALQYRFRNTALRDMALEEKGHYHALRFVGNKLLMLIFADALSARYQLQTEGLLTTLMQELTGHQRLVPVLAEQIGLVDGASKAGRRRLSEKFEAIIGAVWRDCGEDYARVYEVMRHLLTHRRARSFRFRDESYANPDLTDVLDEGPVSEVERRFGYRFRNRFYLLKSVTRRSAVNEDIVSSRVGDFQVYEFIGDKVLGCVIADVLTQRTPDVSAEELQTRFVSLTSNDGPLAAVAENIDLGSLLFMGRGEEQLLIRYDCKALSDHMEALLGGAWLDSGSQYACLRRLIQHHWAHLGLGDPVELECTEAEDAHPLDLASFPVFGGQAKQASDVEPDASEAGVGAVSASSRDYLAAATRKPPESFPLPFWQRGLRHRPGPSVVARPAGERLYSAAVTARRPARRPRSETTRAVFTAEPFPPLRSTHGGSQPARRQDTQPPSDPRVSYASMLNRP